MAVSQRLRAIQGGKLQRYLELTLVAVLALELALIYFAGMNNNELP